jgi:hypothetical protein
MTATVACPDEGGDANSDRATAADHLSLSRRRKVDVMEGERGWG